jgi:hypothetical protein
MKKILILILVASLCSCSKNTVSGPHIGKWKLVTGNFPKNSAFVELPSTLIVDNIDFSNENIIFEFKNNGSVTISDNLLNYVDPDWVAAYEKEHGKWAESLDKGTHTFSSSYDNSNNEVIMRPVKLRIDSGFFTISFSHNTTKMSLKFDMTLHFERID